MVEEIIPVHKTKQSAKKVLLGEVVSDKMEKTIVVKVSRRILHPLYKKLITRTKRFMAHDERSRAQIGDIVNIIESRPRSKNKVWELAAILERKVS